MKKTRIGVLTLLIILVGSCATFAVATPITTLGTVEYYNTQDNFCINEDIQGNANLTSIYSEVDESALKHDKIWYDSLTDNTTYKFTTQKLYVEWWFTPGVKKFVFIDENTNKLYQINVNYSEIDIPENPYEERHQQLVENYTLIMNNYNLTNETLTNITLQFNEIDQLYNITMEQLNVTLTENQNLSENLTDLTTIFTELEEKYNNTDALWKSAIDNVSYYQTEYDGLSGDYAQLKKDHNDLSGAMPWYIIIAIIGAFLFTWIFVRRKTIFEAPPETTDEITTGYGKVHSAIDKHILSRFGKRPISYKTDEGEIKEVTEGKETPAEIPEKLGEKPQGIGPEETPIEKETKKKQIQDDVLTTIHEKIDANTRVMTKQFTDMLTNLNEKVDKIISEKA